MLGSTNLERPTNGYSTGYGSPHNDGRKRNKDMRLDGGRWESVSPGLLIMDHLTKTNLTDLKHIDTFWGAFLFSNSLRLDFRSL